MIDLNMLPMMSNCLTHAQDLDVWEETEILRVRVRSSGAAPVTLLSATLSNSEI